MYKLKATSDFVDEFAFGMMWGGKEARKLYVTNADDVLLAVNKAYDDMSSRTIANLGKVPKAEKIALRQTLAKRIVELFFKDGVIVSSDNFDDIHKKNM